MHTHSSNGTVSPRDADGPAPRAAPAKPQDPEDPPHGGDEAVAPSTRVVTYAVRPGSEEEFLSWHWSLNDLERRFPGFLGSNVIPPAAGDPANEWSIVFGYRSEAALRTWLESPERAAALAAKPDVFTAEKAEYALTPSARPDRSVTIVTSHRVIPGKEAEYRAANRALNEAAARFPGFRGVETFEPSAESREFTVLIRFDGQENMDRWLGSPERARGREEQYRYLQSHRTKVIPTGFGSWFAFNAVGGVEAPAWKQAMTVLSVLFPIVMVLDSTVGSLLQSAGASVTAGTFVGNVLCIASLTWIAMPLITRLMGWWLSPACSRERTWIGAALLLAVYAAELVLFSLASTIL